MNIIVGLLLIVLVLLMCTIRYSIAVKKAKQAVNGFCDLVDGLSADMDSLSDEMFELKSQIAGLSVALYTNEEDEDESDTDSDTEE